MNAQENELLAKLERVEKAYQELSDAASSVHFPRQSCHNTSFVRISDLQTKHENTLATKGAAGSSKKDKKANLVHWTEQEFMCTRVASFLSVKDLVNIMTLVAGSQGKALMIRPEKQLLMSICYRALSPGIRKFDFRQGQIFWRDSNLEMGIQLVSLEALRMLHFVCKSCPSELDRSQGLIKLLGYAGGVQVWSRASPSSAGPKAVGPTFCQIIGRQKFFPLQLEAEVECQECFTTNCTSLIFRECPACLELCSACVLNSHAKRCSLCRSHVCPGCICPSPGDGQQSTLCTRCAFQCFACFVAKPVDEKYECNSGDKCLNQVAKICTTCVESGALQQTYCEMCNKLWCVGCVAAFPPCSGCLNLYCAECSEMKKCPKCDKSYHEDDCSWQNGENCGCGYFACNDCETMENCLVCEESSCIKCSKETVPVCSVAGHFTCTGCVVRHASADACIRIENNWGETDILNNCFKCFMSQYSLFKGFEDVESFENAIRGKMLRSAAGYIHFSPVKLSPYLTGIVQYLHLGGQVYADTKEFDSCKILWDDCFNTPHPGTGTGTGTGTGNGNSPFSLSCSSMPDLLSKLNLNKITVWSSTFVNGLNTLFSTALKSFEFEAESGQHHQPTSTVVSLQREERIVGISIRWGAVIDSIKLVLSTGIRRRQIQFGGAGGENTTNFKVPASTKVIGFYGGIGGHLHNIGVILAVDKKTK